MKRFINFGLMVAMMLITVSAYAEVTPLFNYQGRLTNAAGDPYTGIHTITLGIYDVESGPDVPLRSAAYSRDLKNGYFNILFGAEDSMNLATLPFDKQYWIGVQVDGLTEMTPREKLGSVAYAMRAQTAVQAESATIAANVVDNSITSSKINDATIGTADIGQHQVWMNNIEPNAVMPIGSIIAWHNAVYGFLPENWVMCNGGTVADANSPLNGQAIPDLNNSGRFLRGAPSSGTLQADEFKSHNHQAITSWKSATQTEWHILSDWSDPDQGPLTEVPPGDGPSVTHTGGTETRPVNMGVVWILKIK